MTENDFEEFFGAMAKRFRNETHLSDLTFTALELIPEFKKDFLHFFFPDLSFKDEDEIAVYREFSLGSSNGQPDLVFQSRNWDAIVENKLWDQNYHFDQYGAKPISPRKPTHTGLIANHSVQRPPAASKWQIREWRNFLVAFECKKYPRYDGVFVAYLAYVKRICKMTEFKNFQFDPSSLFALTHFVRMAESALKVSTPDTYRITVQTSKKGNFGESWAGYWFQLHPTDSTEHLSLFFGIDFSFGPPPTIGVHVHKHENAQFQMIADSVNDGPSYKIRREMKDGIVFLNLPNDQFLAINSETAKQKQLDALVRFLHTCCNDLTRFVVAT